MKALPITYIFMSSDQPDIQSWKVIEEFKDFWNSQFEPKFIQFEELANGPEQEWEITFEGGINDKKIPVLETYLNQLHESHGIVWFKGADVPSKPSDYEQNDFVEILGNGYPDSFVINSTEAQKEIKPCETCGNSRYFDDVKITDTLIIDEQLLDAPSPDLPDYYTSPGLDLINIRGGMLISSRIRKILEKHNVVGLKTIPVKNQDGNISERLALLCPTKTILEPSYTHTPVSGKGICPACGTIRGGILNHYYVNKKALENIEIVSRHRLGMTRIAVSKRVYDLLKSENATGLTPTLGFYITDI